MRAGSPACSPATAWSSSSRSWRGSRRSSVASAPTGWRAGMREAGATRSALSFAHGLLITWGYAVTAHTNVISQTTTLLVSYPDVLMASIGGLLLLGVGLVSMRAARKRMRYETWYYLHFYTYLAVALAFSHQFATGADFMTNATARVVWGGM